MATQKETCSKCFVFAQKYCKDGIRGEIKNEQFECMFFLDNDTLPEECKEKWEIMKKQRIVFVKDK